MKNRTKWLAGVAGGIAAFLAALVGIVSVINWDDPPTPDDDLRVTRLNIPDKDNAYFHFLKAARDFELSDERQQPVELPRTIRSKDRQLNIPRKPLPSELRHNAITKLLTPEGWSTDTAVQMLQQNAQALDAFDQGLKYRLFQPPEFTLLSKGPGLPISPLLDLARLAAVRSLYLSQNGKDREAMAQAMKLIRLGQMVEAGAGTLLFYRVGSCCKELGLERIRDILLRTSLSPDILKPVIRELHTYHADQRGWINVIKTEYQINTQALDVVRDHTRQVSVRSNPRLLTILLPSYTFQPNETRRMMQEYYRAVLGNQSRPYAQRAPLPQHPMPQTAFQSLKFRLSPNSLGRAVYWIAIPKLDREGAVFYREDVSVSAAQILLALKCFKAKTGSLPSSLNELVPEYLPKVPADDFDGRPMRYSASRKVVYSVGEDLKDTGGSSEPKFDPKEPAYRIEF